MKKYVKLLFILLGTILLSSINFQAYASDSSEPAKLIDLPDGTRQIIVTSPVKRDELQSYTPYPTYQSVKDGKIYLLKDWKTKEILIEAHSEVISDKIQYKEVEHIDQIPDVGIIAAVDQETGRKKEFKLPLKHVESTEYRWISGFEFPIIVEDYDADVYALGDTMIPGRESEPFAGYESLLLDYVRLSDEYYRIDSVEWSGHPYQKQGIWYREARAKGQKKVKDFSATYEGIVQWEEATGLAAEATYYLEEQPDHALKKEPVYEQDTTQAQEQPKTADWKDFIRHMIMNSKFLTISFSFLILIFIMIYILMKRKK